MMEIHLADAYILPFWWKSSLDLSIIIWVAIYIYFLLYILLSQNWQQDQFQYLRYPKKCIIPSSRNISVTKKSSICIKFRHKSIHINNTHLTTFYCYSATSSVTNLSNKYFFFTKFKRWYHPIVYPIPTLIPKPYSSSSTDVQRTALGWPMYIKGLFSKSMHHYKVH